MATNNLGNFQRERLESNWGKDYPPTLDQTLSGQKLDSLKQLTIYYNNFGCRRMFELTDLRDYFSNDCSLKKLTLDFTPINIKENAPEDRTSLLLSEIFLMNYSELSRLTILKSQILDIDVMLSGFESTFT